MENIDNSKPTMKDVAREADVSLGTVSKVINGIKVGEEYRLRVANAVRNLNYQVNTYAQGLKANKTHTVAVLIPNTSHPYFGLLVYHLHRALADKGYHMLLCCTDYHPEQEQEFVTMAGQRKVDGIIGLTYNPDLQIEMATPFVSIDRTIG